MGLLWKLLRPRVEALIATRLIEFHNDLASREQIPRKPEAQPLSAQSRQIGAVPRQKAPSL